MTALLDVPMSAYLSWRAPGGSTLHKLATICPAACRESVESTPAMVVGQLVHAELFGGSEQFEWGDFKDFKTKAAREWRGEVEASGKTAVLRASPMGDEARRIADAARRIVADAAGVNLDDGGWAFEQSALIEGAWSEMQDFGDAPIRVKARPDAIRMAGAGAGTTLELKVVGAGLAADGRIKRHYRDMGWGYQAAVRRLLKRRLGLGGADLTLIVERETARGRIFEVSDISAQYEERALAAAVRWHECDTMSHWPGYGPEIISLSE